MRAQISTVTLINIENKFNLATTANGPAEKEAIFLIVKVITPSSGHPDLLVICAFSPQHIPVAPNLSEGINFCRNRPDLPHRDRVRSVAWSTNWQLVRLGMALALSYPTRVQNVRVALCPNVALALWPLCILQMTLVFRTHLRITVLMVLGLLRRLVLTEIVVLILRSSVCTRLVNKVPRRFSPRVSPMLRNIMGLLSRRFLTMPYALLEELLLIKTMTSLPVTVRELLSR